MLQTPRFKLHFLPSFLRNSELLPIASFCDYHLKFFTHDKYSISKTFFSLRNWLTLLRNREHFLSRWCYLCRLKGNIQNTWAHVTDDDVLIPMSRWSPDDHHTPCKHLTGWFSLLKHIIYSKVSPPIAFGYFCFNIVLFFWSLKRVYLSETINSITLSCLLSSSFFFNPIFFFLVALFLLHSLVIYSSHSELNF